MFVVVYGGVLCVVFDINVCFDFFLFCDVVCVLLVGVLVDGCVWVVVDVVCCEEWLCVLYYFSVLICLE